MACNTESTEINGRKYTVTQWPAEKALVYKMTLAKVFGPGIATIFGQLNAFSGDSEDPDVNAKQTDALAKGLALIFETSSPEEIVHLIKSSIIGTMCDEGRITESKFTELYSGDNLNEVYKVFMFILKVNYGNFFKGQKAEELLAKVQAI